MYGTTFPSFDGHDPSPPPQESSSSSYQAEKKPWENRQGGDYQKKPWDGQKKQWDGGQKKPFERAKETDMSLYMPYACTGNNDAPAEILKKFEEITQKLDRLGYTARVGGFDGIEDTVEKAVTRKEVHLPWRDFNNKQSKFTFTTDRALHIARQFHPTFDTMKKSVQTFLAKNVRLILGNNVASPALFLLCWTEDGVESIRDRTSRTGFAGHPIAIASALNMPVFNLGRAGAEQRLELYLANAIIPAVPTTPMPPRQPSAPVTR